MKYLKQILITVTLLAATNMAYACFHNGTNYPEGTILGPYICSGGTWVPR